MTKFSSSSCNFFGARQIKKYICYTKWDRLTAPKSEGGLGLRGIHTLNSSLILKKLWKATSGHSALWVSIISAKYYPASSLWQNKRNHSCTRFWKVMEHRQVLALHLLWCIGDGRLCPAYSAPWFQDWRSLVPTTLQQRSLKVVSLQILDMQKLLNFGGFGHALRIMDQHKNLTLQTDVPDKLMFTWATNGQRPVLGQTSISHDERITHVECYLERHGHPSSC